MRGEAPIVGHKQHVGVIRGHDDLFDVRGFCRFDRPLNQPLPAKHPDILAGASATAGPCWNQYRKVSIGPQFPVRHGIVRPWNNGKPWLDTRAGTRSPATRESEE